jgi:hypothetical protein
MTQHNLKEKNNMKRKIRNPLRIFAAVLALAAGICVTNAAAFGDNDDACSVASLKGSYGIQSTGSIVALGPIGPIAEAGTITFDGAGGVLQITTVSIGGLGGQINANRTSLSGSYTVNADCTGDLAVILPVPGGTTTSTSHFVIVDHGKEIRLVNSGTGRVIVGNARKQ